MLVLVLVLRTTYFVDNLRSCYEDADAWNVIHRVQATHSIKHYRVAAQSSDPVFAIAMRL